MFFIIASRQVKLFDADGKIEPTLGLPYGKRHGRL
jgi:hypothetical protein